MDNYIYMNISDNIRVQSLQKLNDTVTEYGEDLTIFYYKAISDIYRKRLL